MSSRLFYAYVIGLLALSLLFFLAIPYYSKQIPISIKRDAQEQLATVGANWATVKSANRDLILTGVAPTSEDQDTAINALKHVSIVRNIQDDTTQNIVSPYLMSLKWKDEKLVINGVLPDAQSQQKVLEILKEKYGDKDISQQIKIAQGEPKQWTALIATILGNIPVLDRANVDLVDQDLDFSAQTEKTVDKEKLLKSLEGFEEHGYRIKTHVIAKDTGKLRCQRQIDESFNNTQILFSSGKAVIQNTSHALLQKLAQAAQSCPDLLLDIVGHTDSQGSDKSNLELSRERAQSVAQWLLNWGIDQQRLRTIGYGSERPIADNGTELGRAKNRRIEFIVRSY